MIGNNKAGGANQAGNYGYDRNDGPHWLGGNKTQQNKIGYCATNTQSVHADLKIIVGH